MPTGYTSKIADGISFKDFALCCARNFGACIELRDDSMDTPIPDEFKPSDYHSKELAAANKRLIELKSMTVAQCEKAAKKKYSDSMQRYIDALAENKALLEKYSAMLAEVKEWTPPSSEHTRLKSFMQEQIEQSIEFDCGGTYYQDALKNLKQLTPTQWREEKINAALQDVSYHAAKQEEDNIRAQNNTTWVKKLRDSLK